MDERERLTLEESRELLERVGRSLVERGEVEDALLVAKAQARLEHILGIRHPVEPPALCELELMPTEEGPYGDTGVV